MKKILTLLFLCLAFAWGTALGQNINAPDTVCSSTDPVNKRWATVSLNANNLASTEWRITRNTVGGAPAVLGVDYRILYGFVNVNSNATETDTTSSANRSLTIEFLRAGRYYVRAIGQRSSGSQVADVNRRIQVLDCPMALCPGVNEDMPGFKEDFGSVTTRVPLDPSRGAIEYAYEGSAYLADSFYSISNQMQLRPEWDTSKDHTLNTNGGMLVANSSYEPITFYSRRVNGLCKGANYNFSAWFRNANGRSVLESTCRGGYIYAGVTFEILNAANNALLATFRTYDVSMPLHKDKGQNRGWQQYGGSFKTPPGVENVIVRIKNNNPGGCGNDIAIDDISFKYCAPQIYSFFDGQTDIVGGHHTMCAGAATKLTSVINPLDYFTKPKYLWEYRPLGETNWTLIDGDVDGVTGSDSSVLVFAEDALLLQGDPNVITSMQFRLKVYEDDSVDLSSCAQPSEIMTVELLPNPRITVAGAQICLGDTAVLKACCGYDLYKWRWGMPNPTDSVDESDIDTLLVFPTTTTTYEVIGRKDYGNGRTCYRRAEADVEVYTMPTLNLALTGTSPICIGQSVTLGIDPLNIVYPILWTPSGEDGVTLTHTPASVGTHEYKVTVTNEACVAEDSINIEVLDLPDLILDPVNPSCSDMGSFNITYHDTANNPALYSIRAAGANPMPGFVTVTERALTASPISVSYPIGVAAGTYTFEMTLRNPVLDCERVKTFSVTIVTPSQPPTGIINSSPQICVSGPVTLTVDGGSLGTNARWAWYQGGCGSGTAFAYGPTVTIDPVTATTTYYVRAENIAGTCSPTVCASTTVTVFERPDNANAGPDQEHCEVPTFIMAGSSPSVGQGTWSVVSATNTDIANILITDIHAPGTTVTVPNGASAVLRWTITNGTCTSTPDEVTLINNSRPTPAAAGPDQKECDVTSFTLAATPVTIGTGAWATLSGGRTVTNVNDPVTTITVAPGDSIVLQWTATNGNCPPSRDTVVLVSYLPPSPAVAGPDQRLCDATSFSLNATNPAVGTGMWSTVFGSRTVANAASNTTTITVAPGDSVILVWTVSNGNCPSTTDTVTLVSYEEPTQAIAGPDQKECDVTSFTLAANDPAVGTGSWSTIYGGKTVANAAAYNTSIAVVPGDSVILVWTVSNGNCTPTTDTVTLVSYERPTVAVAGPDQKECDVTSFTLAANDPAVGTGSWSTIYGSKTVANAAAYNTSIAVVPGDSVILVWTVSNGNCTPSTDTVTLVSYEEPTQAIAGPDQKECDVTSFTLAANDPAVGTGSWSTIFGGKTVANAAAYNTSIAVVPGDSVILVWTVSNGNCTPTTDTVTLVSYERPTVAAAGPDQKECDVTSFTLAANDPAVGTGSWSTIWGGRTVANAADHNTSIVVAPGDSVILVWSVANGNCTPSTDTVTLVSYERSSPAVAGADQRLCDATSFNLNATNPAVGTGSWTTIYGGINVANPNSNATTIAVTPGDSVILVWTVSNGNCPANTDTITLVSYEQAAPALAGPDQKACNVNTFTLDANAPGAATATGSWTIFYGTPVISDLNDPKATVTVAIGDSTVLIWNIANGACPPSADTVVLVSYQQAAIANAGPDQKDCDVSSFNLAANAPGVATATGTWAIVRGTPVISDLHNPAATATVTVGDSVVLTWTIINGACPPTTDTVVLVSYMLPSAPVAGPDQEQCNNSTFTLAATAPTSGTGSWTVVGGSATITDPTSPTSTVQVPAGMTATLRWTVANGLCPGNFDEVILSNLNPVTGNTISADQLLCPTEAAVPLGGGTITGGNGTYTYQWQSSTVSATAGFSDIPGANAATYAPGIVAQDSIWYRRIVHSGPCMNNISNPVKIIVITRPPVVVFVPGPITTNCVLGRDYTTLFGTPQFSHTPYEGLTLTITFSDATSVNGCIRTFTRTWTATDRCGMTTTASQTITVVDNLPPVFTTPKPADITVNCDAIPPVVNLTAYDSCAGNMTIVPVETRQNIPGACVNNYRLIRTWTANDGCGNVANLTQIITVQDTTRPVFNMAPPRDTIVNCDAVPAAPVLTASDNCTPGVITVTATDTRQNIPGSRCADYYQIIRTWIARDECGNAATVRQTITVQDTTRPTFSIPQPANVTVDCDRVPAWPAVTATDNCSANVAVVTNEQKIPTQPACANNYRLIRTWTARDNCGNTATMQQIITVQDTTRPTFTMLPPADTMVSCDAVPPPANNVTATDNCAGTVRLSRTQVRESIAGECASNYRLIRTWTAIDECGNTAVIRQVVTVRDTTAPVITAAPADLVLNCGDAIPAPVVLNATDNCDPSFPKRVTAVEDPYVKDVCAGYTIIRRWRIADACGNQAIERVQRITVNPCPKPELDPALPVNCSDNPRFTIQLRNRVNNPTYILVGVTPANAIQVPLSQKSNVFNLNGATQAQFIVQDGVTGCVSDTMTYNLQYSTKPMVNLGRDTTICGGNSLILDAGAANFAYTIRWSTGETTQRINVSAAGTYWVTVTNGICVTSDTIRVGLIPMPLVNLPDASICRGQSVKLDAFVDGATYLWSTGATTPSILVSTQEQFWVRVTKSACITIDTVNVTVNPPPDISLNRDTTICPDQSIMLTVNVMNGGSIRWATGATTSSIVVNEPGLYWVTVSRDNCMVRDTVNVRLQPGINVDLGPNREICPGGRITIDGTTQDAISYLWDDGDPNPVKEVSATGKYRLAVMDRFCQRVYLDSMRVMVTGTPFVNLGNDTMMCIGETLRLRADGANITSVLWSDGSTGPFLDVTRAGTYTVTVSNDCGNYTDQITVDYMQCDPKPTFPNAFSPNGDGRNDSFRPVVKGPMYEYELRIFNRWGELIYLGRDSKKGWDGRYHGEPVGVGTYVWWLTYKKMPGGNPNIIKGEVTVIK